MNTAVAMPADQKPWEVRGVRPEHDGSSLIAVQVLNAANMIVGYVVVIEPHRSDAVYKFAAGHQKPGENPLEAARRELAGETGLNVDSSAFTYVSSEWREGRAGKPGHWSNLFTADIREDDVPWMHNHHPENEGEVPKYLSYAEFLEHVRAKKFLAYHAWRMQAAGLLNI